MFDVTPTSGAAPYIFTTGLNDRYGLDVGLYSLRFYEESAVGSCPPPGTTGQARGSVASNLLNNGTATIGQTVPSGNCVTYTLVIIEGATNNIVSQASVNVDNI